MKEAHQKLDEMVRNTGLLHYRPENIYNFDETALYWRALSKKDLLSKVKTGRSRNNQIFKEQI